MDDPYERHSSVTTPDQIAPPPLRDEIAKVARDQGIDNLATASHCAVTRSRRLKKPGLFSRMMGTADKDAEHSTAVVVTKTAVLVGVSGEQRGTKVFFLPLATLELLELPRLGITVAPSVTFKSPSLGADSGNVGTYSVYFGAGDIADRTRAAVRDAMHAMRG